MAYSKLFSSIVHSSLWTEEDHVRLLFVTLLAIADREGYVYGSRLGLERLANIRKSERNPWTVLMEPDADSSDLMRNPENEGRRIEEVPGGFRILNFMYYRGLRNEDDRRKTNREAKRRQRARDKLTPASASVNHSQPKSAKVSQSLPISDADADTDTERKKGSVRGFPHGLPDSEWIEQLCHDPTYAGIDVKREHGKMVNWCKTKGLTPSRRRFINWLNRAEQPMTAPVRTDYPKDWSQTKIKEYEEAKKKYG
jgi:hypothetical protein